MPPEGWELLNYTVSGLLVLTGVLVSQLFGFWTAYSDRKERRERLLREKYEELCNSILDTNLQVQEMLRMKPTEELLAGPPPSFLQMCYLAMIYFPELTEATGEYNDAVVGLYQTILKHTDARDPAALGLQALMNNPEYSKILDNCMKLRVRLQRAIEEHAPKYTKA